MGGKIRKPFKGTGVPKETPSANSLSAVENCLAGALGLKAGQLKREIIAAGYFEASMQKQRGLVADIVLQYVSIRDKEVDRVVELLGQSNIERVRGLAPVVVMRRFRDRLGSCLQRLKRTGMLPGAWPQEHSQGYIHQLVIEHGFMAVMEHVESWLDDEQLEVRRLVVEAFRPRGVMIPHIQELRENPRPLRAILERVLDDESGYVRKAAANCINDISRDHPDLVCEWCESWMADVSSHQRRWIIQHGLRTLLKAGNQRAMALVGLGHAGELELVRVGALPGSVEINELLSLKVVLRNLARETIRARVQVRLVGPGKGTKPRSKVYLVRVIDVPPQGTAVAEKAFHFSHSNSQPRLPGTYRIHFFANGKEMATRSFLWTGE